MTPHENNLVSQIMSVPPEERSVGLVDSQIQRMIQKAYEFSSLSTYSWKDRLMVRAADFAFFVLIKVICSSIGYEVVGWENWQTIANSGQLPIYTFWHNRVFIATHFWQQRRIVVMTSQSFDGEYIARFIKRFGYGAARGSSTRGGTGAIVEMVRLMRAGCPTAFTIDGPRGPRYVAKMGAVLLAKKTGQPILPFIVTARRHWEANSWDRFQVPLPFTTARVEIAAPIYVPGDATDKVLNSKRDELQYVLDTLNAKGEKWKAGEN